MERHVTRFASIANCAAGKNLTASCFQSPVLHCSLLEEAGEGSPCVPSTPGSTLDRLISELCAVSMAAPQLLLLQGSLSVLLGARFRLHSQTGLSGTVYFCLTRTQRLCLSA